MQSRKFAKVAAVPAGLLVAGLLVAQSSSAAFTAQTSTGANTFGAASIALTNDKVGTAVFAVDGIVPGQSGTRSVAVTYTGTSSVGVKMYAKDGDTTGALADALQLTVKVDSTQVYSGTLAGFSAKTTYAQGVGTWAPTSTASKTYEVTWSLPTSATNTVQGDAAQLKFVWEAQTA